MKTAKDARALSAQLCLVMLALLVLAIKQDVRWFLAICFIHLAAGFIAFCAECRPSWKKWSWTHMFQLVSDLLAGIVALHNVKIAQADKKDHFPA